MYPETSLLRALRRFSLHALKPAHRSVRGLSASTTVRFPLLSLIRCVAAGALTGLTWHVLEQAGILQHAVFLTGLTFCALMTVGLWWRRGTR